MAVSRDAVLSALEGVIDPELKRSVVELDMVRDVRVDGGDVSVTIALTVPGCPLRAGDPGARSRKKDLAQSSPEAFDAV